MTDVRSDLGYSTDHLWVRPSSGDGVVRIGVTDFAQQALGDVVDLSLPSVGVVVQAGEACGDIESVKSVSDLVAPVSGEVVGVNDEVAGSPELVNADPYGKGWLFEVSPSSVDALLSADAYRELTGA